MRGSRRRELLSAAGFAWSQQRPGAPLAPFGREGATRSARRPRRPPAAHRAGLVPALGTRSRPAHMPETRKAL